MVSILSYPMPVRDDLVILCPFHEDSNPSCSISFHRYCFYCFACGAKGQLTKLIAELEGIDELHAALLLLKLEKKHQSYFEEDHRSSDQIMDIRKRRTMEAYRFYRTLPRIDWTTFDQPYLKGTGEKERGFTPETLSRFRVKYNPGGMYPLIFPLYSKGIFVGYTARALVDIKPKYKNNPGLPRTQLLLGRKIRRGPILVVEGHFDEMMADQHGFWNVAELLNWQITRKQAKILAQFATEVICGLDNDTAGERGYELLQQEFAPYRVPISRFGFMGQKDIGETKDRRLFWEGIKYRLPAKRIF